MKKNSQLAKERARSLDYYHRKIKPDPEKMAARRKYALDYYYQKKQKQQSLWAKIKALFKRGGS